jgi:hypothetical protein
LASAATRPTPSAGGAVGSPSTSRRRLGENYSRF